MKISIIGAGNVGGMSALRIAQAQLGEVLLYDLAGNIAEAKVLDIQDSQYVLAESFRISFSREISGIRDSDIVIITAGLARKPGMTREDLLLKNGLILKELCLNIKNLSGQAIVIVVTNPLDLMTLLALKYTGFPRERIIGMGASLDASRFANLIAKKLDIPLSEIEAWVVGSHGEGMLPLLRLSKVKGRSLSEFLKEEEKRKLLQETIERGAQIVNLLGSGSAYFAPSAAVFSLVKSIVRDEKRIWGVSCYLNGEWGIKDVCLGTLARIGKRGIEDILPLDLAAEEKEALQNTASRLRDQFAAFQEMLTNQ